MADTLSRCGNKVRLIVYSDEVTPGQQLNARNDRKTHAVHWSLADFPIAALSCEDAWFAWTALRTTEVSNIDGGLSHVLKVLLKTSIHNPYGMRHGVSIDLGFDALVLLFGDVHCTVQDLLAHKQSTLCKGHAGHRVSAVL